MGRKPRSVGYEYIEKTRARRMTYEKRRAGLEKKMYELSTLCDLKIGLVIYGPKDENGEIPKEPTIWPRNPHEFGRILAAFTSMPKDEKKNYGISKFFEDRIKKLSEAKAKSKAEADPYPTWSEGYKTSSPAEMLQFHSVLDSRVQRINARIEFLKSTHHQTHDDSLLDDDVKAALAMAFKEDNNNNDAYSVQNLHGCRGSSCGGGMEMELYHPPPPPPPQQHNVSCYNPLISIADDHNGTFHDSSVNMSSNYLVNASLINNTADEFAVTIQDSSVNISSDYFNPFITINDHASFQNPMTRRMMMNDEDFLNNVMPPVPTAANYSCHNYDYNHAPSAPVGLVNPNSAAAQLGFQQPLFRCVPPLQAIPPSAAYPLLYDAAGLPPPAAAHQLEYNNGDVWNFPLMMRPE